LRADWCAPKEPHAQFTPPATQDKTVLSVSYPTHIRQCELSLETVWQSLNSWLVDHPRRVAFKFRFSHMQQFTACLHFCVTYDVRVGGRSARCSCLPDLRRGGGRQAGARVVLSGMAV